MGYKGKGKWVARWGMKRVGKALPLVGGLFSYGTAREAGASQSSAIANGVIGALAPVDAQDVTDGLEMALTPVAPVTQGLVAGYQDRDMVRMKERAAKAGLSLKDYIEITNGNQ